MPNQTEMFLMLFADDLSLLSSAVRGATESVKLAVCIRSLREDLVRRSIQTRPK